MSKTKLCFSKLKHAPDLIALIFSFAASNFASYYTICRVSKQCATLVNFAKVWDSHIKSHCSIDEIYYPTIPPIRFKHNSIFQQNLKEWQKREAVVSNDEEVVCCDVFFIGTQNLLVIFTLF